MICSGLKRNLAILSPCSADFRHSALTIPRGQGGGDSGQWGQANRGPGGDTEQKERVRLPANPLTFKLLRRDLNPQPSG